MLQPVGVGVGVVVVVVGSGRHFWVFSLDDEDGLQERRRDPSRVNCLRDQPPEDGSSPGSLTAAGRRGGG